MRDQDWEVLMKALSIYVQGIHFSKGTTQAEQNAIADHMIGVAEVIEKHPQPAFVKAGADANIRLRKELDAVLLQNEGLHSALSLLKAELTERGERIEASKELLEGAMKWMGVDPTFDDSLAIRALEQKIFKFLGKTLKCEICPDDCMKWNGCSHECHRK